MNLSEPEKQAWKAVVIAGIHAAARHGLRRVLAGAYNEAHWRGAADMARLLGHPELADEMVSFQEHLYTSPDKSWHSDWPAIVRKWQAKPKAKS